MKLKPNRGVKIDVRLADSSIREKYIATVTVDGTLMGAGWGDTRAAARQMALDVAHS